MKLILSVHNDWEIKSINPFFDNTSNITKIYIHTTNIHSLNENKYDI
jgi:hypothetical protein